MEKQYHSKDTNLMRLYNFLNIQTKFMTKIKLPDQNDVSNSVIVTCPLEGVNLSSIIGLLILCLEPISQ